MKCLLTIACLFLISFCFGQGEVVNRIKNLKAQGAFTKPVQKLYYGRNVAANIKPGRSTYLKMNLEGNTLYLEKVEMNPNVVMSDSSAVAYPDIAFYRGTDKYGYLAAISITSENGAEGTLYAKSGNINFGMVKSGYMVVNDLLLKNDRPDFNCPVKHLDAKSLIPKGAKKLSIPKATTSNLTTKCVQIYWETDYDLFVNKGAGLTAYMTGAFNQMATLYANDGISLNLKTLYINVAPDNYTGPSTSNYLTQFGSYRTTFDGDLAQLIGISGGGGVAWLNGLIFCQYGIINYSGRMSYASIYTSYAAVPTYSWTITVLAHELGHQLGSNHTHDCVWNGNNTQIDGCGNNAGYTSGTCPNVGDPAGGGTVMSYCHLRGGVGINFNKGFGPQPKALMINNINNSICLLPCGNPPPCTIPTQPLSISGNINVLQGSSNTYSIAAVTGATSYVWSIPPTWTGNSTGTSITATVGSTGTISVAAVNSCGRSSFQNLSVNTYIEPPTEDSCQKVTVTIVQQTSRLLSIGKNCTNCTYSYKKNGIAMTWKTNVVAIGLVKKDDFIEVSCTTPSLYKPYKCVTPGKATTIVK